MDDMDVLSREAVRRAVFFLRMGAVFSFCPKKE
jgi:hypothetical protein